MKKLVTGLALSGLVFSGFAAVVSAKAAEVTVMSWGGAYTTSQVEAYHKPFAAKTGIKVNSVDADNPGTPIKAMVEAKNVTVDVADVELSDAVRLCDEGMLEKIDAKKLPAAPDGTPATKDFLQGALTPCAVGSILWSTAVAYNADKVKGTPTSINDFFDTTKYPGKRGLRKGAKINFEMALMADGVAPKDVYKTLKTKAGVDRALKKLSTIKNDVVWWEAGAQPPQLLADGEVVMSTAYNGRIFDAAVKNNKPLKMMWDGQILDYDLFVIPKGAKNLKEANEFVAYATDTQRLADQTKWISYGPARKSSTKLVGKYNDGKTDMAPHMPTSPAAMKNALFNDFQFWADHDAELNERFNAWLAG